MNSERLSCQQPASRALNCAATGQLPYRTQGRAPCHSIHVCTHTPVLKSLFFQSSNGLTSTPAALPEDRQALELHLFLTHTARLHFLGMTAHTEAGQLPRRGQQQPRAWTFPALSGRFPLQADSAATMELCQPHSSAGAAGNSQMFY